MGQHDFSLMDGESAHVVPDIFAISDGDRYILYAPLAEVAISCNEAQVAALLHVKASGKFASDAVALREAGLVHRGPGPCKQAEAVRSEQDADSAYLPTKVTLFPTNDCNLACTYCYSRAGETNERLDPKLAEAAIDTLVQNALRLGKTTIQVHFHGGGEPFHNFSLMKHAVDYGRAVCKHHSLEMTSHTATNGVLNESQLEWLCSNMDAVSLSIDGPPEIQDKQRPLKVLGGGRTHSSEFVLRTMRFLESRGKSYGIRCTVTNENVEHLRALVDFFLKESSVRSAQLEPVFVTGRCHSSGVDALEPQRFLSRLVDAYEYGHARGFHLRYSGSTLWSRRTSFCGVDGRNFFLTPEGHISTCNEVTRKSDHHSDRYIVGQVSPSGLTVDETKLNELRRRRLPNLPNCQKCFAKYNCAGDCAVKMDDPFDTSTNERCYVNRGILLHQLRRSLERGREAGSA